MIDVTIEFAFGSTWLDDPDGYTWVDETERGEEIPEVIRGRSSELELYSAGTAVIVLDSAGRRFDPLNAAGPYYGQLVPGVPVRISADGEPVFYGFVDGWDHAVGKFKGTVTVTATDAFKYLANVPLPRSVYEWAVRQDAPWLYWPLWESGTDVAADLSGNRRDGRYTRRSQNQGASSIRPFSGGSLELLEGGDVGVLGKLGERIDSGPITIECWIHPSPDNTQPALFRFGSGTTGDGVTLFVDPTGSQVLFGVKYDTSGAGVWAYPDDNRPHHLIVTRIPGAIYNCWIDGEIQPPVGSGPVQPDTFEPRAILGARCRAARGRG